MSTRLGRVQKGGRPLPLYSAGRSRERKGVIPRSLLGRPEERGVRLGGSVFLDFSRNQTSCERITYSVENGKITERNNATNTESRKSHTLINDKVDKGCNDKKKRTTAAATKGGCSSLHFPSDESSTLPFFHPKGGSPHEGGGAVPTTGVGGFSPMPLD